MASRDDTTAFQRSPSQTDLREETESSSVPLSPGSQQKQLLPQRHSTARSKAVILIGGPTLGTRFRPLSLQCPKPLFPVAGRPMVFHHMEAAAQVPGMMEILLIGTFPENEMREFVGASARDLGVPVRYLREYTSLGTGGGIYHFRDQILRGKPDAFFVLHCDLCSDFPLTELLQFHGAHGDNRHATVMSVKAQKTQAKYYGCLVVGADDSVQHYVEKPETFVSTDINCGIYVFSPAIFDDIRLVFLRNHDSGADGDFQEEIWLERDIIPGLTGTGRLFVYKSQAFWSQIKTAGRHYLNSYSKLHPERLARQEDGGPLIDGNVFIHPTAVVAPTAKIGPNVTIGPNVRVGAGARVRDAIVLSGASLKDHCCVLNSIIGWNSTLGEWTRLEGHEQQMNPNDPTTTAPAKPLFNHEGKLEPSITIVGEGVNIGEGLIVRNSIVLPHKDLNRSYQNEIIL